jgi:uncharacterized protein (TIGR02246 family)
MAAISPCYWLAFPLRLTSGLVTLPDAEEATSIVVSEDGILFPGQDAVASERLVRATWVLVRRDGGWRIASYHNSPAS